MLGQIFTKAQNKITDPAKLARLIVEGYFGKPFSRLMVFG
jgi:hypothetical protein